MWGTVTSSLPGADVFLLSATTVYWSSWYLPCAAVSQLHCTLMTRDDDSPTADKGLCEWASYTQMY